MAASTASGVRVSVFVIVISLPSSLATGWPVEGSGTDDAGHRVEESLSTSRR